MVTMETEVEKVASETSGASSMVTEEASIGSSDAELQQNRRQWAANRSTSVIETVNSVTSEELKELKQWFQVMSLYMFWYLFLSVHLLGSRACVTRLLIVYIVVGTAFLGPSSEFFLKMPLQRVLRLSQVSFAGFEKL